MGSFDYLLREPSGHDKTDKTDRTPVEGVGGDSESDSFGSFDSFDSFVRVPPEVVADAGPQEWLEGVSRLRGMSNPKTVAGDSWAAFLGSCESFIASPWPGKASRMRWDAYDLFGCHNLKPVERVGRMGLLWLLGGGRIAALTSGTAAIEMPSGSRLTYRTNPIREPGDVLAWELG